MRFGLHMGTLRGAGSAAVGQNLLGALRDDPRGHRYVAWVPREWPGSAAATAVELRLTRPGLGAKLLLENVDIRLACRRLDALFSVGDTSLPRCPAPHLLMVQQAFLTRDLDELTFAVPRAFAAKIRLMQAYLRATLATVDRVTVQTHDMATRLSRRTGFAREHIDVIPSPVVLRDVSTAPPVGGPPYVAVVTSAAAHKNLAVLPSVLAALRDNGPKGLVFRVTLAAGDAPQLEAEVARRGVSERLWLEGRVDAARVHQLLRDARAALVPSRLESFGLGYYEAMGHGLPVVCADEPFAREACGDAGFYAPGGDGVALAEVLVRALSQREVARGRSLARFAEVAVDGATVADRYVRLLERVAERSR